MPLPDRPVWRCSLRRCSPWSSGSASWRAPSPRIPARSRRPGAGRDAGAVGAARRGQGHHGSAVGRRARVVEPGDPNDLTRAPGRERSSPPAPKPSPDGPTEGRQGRRRPPPRRPAYKGRNHVWMPALGIDRSVSCFSCSNSAYPGNRVYRWGCAGAQQRLPVRARPQRVQAAPRRLRRRPAPEGHEALLRRRQRQVVHATRSPGGRSRPPTRAPGPTPAQSRPSLTLQTCVGARSQYRLIVRLAKVD